MDAATLFMITTLATGREAETALREYPTVAECQAFVDKAAKNKPKRFANVRHECRRHYQIAPR